MKKKYTNKLIHISEIKEELKHIEGTKDYITPSGKVYCDYGNDMMFPRKAIVNKNNNYLYTALTKEDGSGNFQRRLHVVVAENYIPNPDNLPIVMHIDNDKGNPNVNNLKWGTVSENTKDAFNDGLAYNDIGFDDSQSIEVCQFDLDYNLINIYGSVSEAARATGLTKSGIIFQCDHKMKSKPRCGYYFRYLEEYDFFEEFIL